MPSEVQWRGGNTSQNNNFTGAEREVTVNEDTHALRVHDGVTAGGYELARADLSNAVGIVSITASGDIAADSFVKVGGSSTEFLKADGSVDSSVYLTFESDTLDSVTDRGNITINGIAVGVVTASSFVRVGGSSTQFLKADGSVDSTVYLSSYTETDTLNTVTSRGNVTTNGISVGVITATNGNFSGIVTANGGFNIGISSAGTTITSGPIKTLNFVGAGNTFAVRGTTIDISIQGGGGGGESFWGRSTLGIHTLSSVGIGTTNPIQPLQVGVGTNVVVVDAQGDVGIGTTNPTSKLHVVGDINLDDGGTFTTTVQCITPTANRVISYPDATGTVALVAGSSGQLLWNNAGANAGASTLTYDGSILTTSGRFINSYNATASSPAKLFSGTWFTGGTATTTKPQFLIEPAGTPSTGWSTSGTGLGVNAPSGFAGNLLDLQVNGVSQLKVINNGALQIRDGAVLAYAASNLLDINLNSATTPGASTFYRFNTSTGFQLHPNCLIGWGSSNATSAVDLSLFRDAANTLAQRNAANAQTYRLYNTFTSATNFERLNVRWTSNEAIIDTEAGGGGGTLRGLKIGSAGTSLLGFYGATPVVRPSAVADLTTTATTGSLPTPDGSVTIANAATPTVNELLEYCVELEAKLEAALSRLRELGLIAS